MDMSGQRYAQIFYSERDETPRRDRLQRVRRTACTPVDELINRTAGTNIYLIRSSSPGLDAIEAGL
jgi:hypothetical protein